ncbi:hypothetical protein [Clostridium botulinum]|uniref:hypothetical protein n=1 Tax=Clostridium botulinum TaxID=1491 RepID=UPI001E4183E0|nr:hypothetical protein [Clostridium botulinum]MCD3223974.1 hypothetical protein [Clostridium botulinum C/D]
MELINAKEARKQTLQNIDVIVSRFLEREKLEGTLVDRINRHINNGELKVEHYTGDFIYQAKENILKEMYKIFQKFIEKGYNITVEELGSDYWVKYLIKIEW